MSDFNTLAEAWRNAGWLGLAGAALTLAVKVISGDLVQSTLKGLGINWALWDNWADWQKRIVLFVLSAIGGVITAIGGGMSWGAAMISVVPVAFSAHVLHSALKWDNQKSINDKAIEAANKMYGKPADNSLAIVVRDQIDGKK